MRRLLLVKVACLLLVAGLTGCFPSSTTPSDEQKEPHFMTGRVRVKALDYAGAMAEFDQALAANPRNASAHFELGWLNQEHTRDFAAAIYHYQEYIKLRPATPFSDRAREQIRACKMDLAKSEVLGPVTQGLQKMIDQLTSENDSLRRQIEVLRAQVANRATPAARDTPTPSTVQGDSPAASRPGVTIIRPESPSSSARPSSSGTSPAAVASRPATHKVKSGETFTAIARLYNVKPERLQAANPGINTRLIKVGQVLKIPAS